MKGTKINFALAVFSLLMIFGTTAQAQGTISVMETNLVPVVAEPLCPIFNPSFAVAGRGSEFIFIISDPVDPSVISMVWDFGNGIVQSGSTATMGHNFSSFGSYVVTLIMSSACETKEFAVLVNAGPASRAFFPISH